MDYAEESVQSVNQATTWIHHAHGYLPDLEVSSTPTSQGLGGFQGTLDTHMRVFDRYLVYRRQRTLIILVWRSRTPCSAFSCNDNA
jgi:hypothetical protein